jgi:hypothetical protein
LQHCFALLLLVDGGGVEVGKHVVALVVPGNESEHFMHWAAANEPDVVTASVDT